MPHFTLSSLSLHDPAGHCRLHSRTVTLLTRVFAVLLLLNLWPIVGAESLREASVHGAVSLAFAWFLWFRPKPVVATPRGLAVGAGKRQRLIPWSRVLDVRELPWIRFSPPWYGKMWQVDLSDDERFDFCGVRNAREIVIEFVRRSEARREQHPVSS